MPILLLSLGTGLPGDKDTHCNPSLPWAQSPTGMTAKESSQSTCPSLFLGMICTSLPPTWHPQPSGNHLSRALPCWCPASLLVLPGFPRIWGQMGWKCYSAIQKRLHGRQESPQTPLFDCSRLEPKGAIQPYSPTPGSLSQHCHAPWDSVLSCHVSVHLSSPSSPPLVSRLFGLRAAVWMLAHRWVGEVGR